MEIKTIDQHQLVQPRKVSELQIQQKTSSKTKNYQIVSPRLDYIKQQVQTSKVVKNSQKTGNIDDYLVQKQIGEGCYAQVHLGVNKTNAQKVAIKSYEKQALIDPVRKRNFEREVNILNQIQHKNVLKLVDNFDNFKYQFLVMEYLGNMTLFQLLKVQQTERLRMNVIKDIFRQIVQGIHYLHSKHIIHRDIKLENIMIEVNDDKQKDNKYHIKVIDFGFAIQIRHNQLLDVFCGTPCYMSPEILSKQNYNGYAADVWALGVLLYVLMVGRFPFRSQIQFNEQKKHANHQQQAENELFTKIKKGKIDYPDELETDCKELLSRMFNQNVKQRLTTTQILKHSWLQ